MTWVRIGDLHLLNWLVYVGLAGRLLLTTKIIDEGQQEIRGGC